MPQTVKDLPITREIQVQTPGQEDPLEKEMANHFSILAWRISWAEEPGGLQSTGSHRVGQPVTTTQSAWGHKELDTAEWLTFNLHRILQGRSSIKDGFTIKFFKKYKIHEEIFHLLQELDEQKIST